MAPFQFEAVNYDGVVPDEAKSGVAAKRPALSDPERWVEEHGDYLFKYALSRLRDPTVAEDLVQETFLAALRGGQRFEGRSSEKSWLVGILKNKIFDYFRKASRETPFTNLEFYADEESGKFGREAWLTDARGQDEAATEWARPGASLDSEVFWRIFRDCAGKLPRNVSAVFTMRELDGIESKEICALLNITENNLWVMLHRARMALRRCMEANWLRK